MKVRCFQCGTERESMDCTWTEAGWFCCFCEDAEHIAELVKAGESWESAVAIVRKQREAAA